MLGAGPRSSRSRTTSSVSYTHLDVYKRQLLDNLLVDGKEPGSWGVFITRSEMYTQAAQMNGMISYLAIYIGFVLVVACAAILSIQQLSNVADGSRSYRVLAQIGCDDRQIRHSVMAQQAVFLDVYKRQGRGR